MKKRYVILAALLVTAFGSSWMWQKKTEDTARMAR